MTDSLLDENTLPTFGRLMQVTRERRGLSVREAAELTNNEIGQMTVWRVERGDRDPQFRTLRSLARAYDCDIVIHRDGTVAVRGPGLKTAIMKVVEK